MREVMRLVLVLGLPLVWVVSPRAAVGHEGTRRPETQPEVAEPPSQETSAAGPASSPPPHPLRRPRWAFVAVGAGVFATTYVAALFTSVIYYGFPDCDDCERRAAQLAIPIAGPWLFNRSEAPQWRDPSWPWVAWSAAQAAGVGLLIVGLIGHDVSAEKRTPREPRVTLVPVVTGRTNAVSLSLRW